jgi:pimeloyl-ACP methyl ester carboxylesterase
MPHLQLQSAGRIHYLDSGEGPLVVLLHANPGDARDFSAVLPALARTHRVIAVDWPGYGDSESLRDPYSASVTLLYRVLREFLATLALPPALFIGNSVGGNVAARLAAVAPELVRGLVLVAPGGFTVHNLMTRAFCALQASRFSLAPVRFAKRYLRVRNAATSAMLTRAATLQSTAPALALNRALWRSFNTAESDLRLRANAITATALLIFGEHDPAISAARDGRVAAACIPTAQLHVLPCGHAAFAELPEAFLALVEPFLARCNAKK